ncbi:MAG TPA: hypothetical protein VMV27_07780 [Candidatus Binataceae bacterium]|nr:hypothetical protein [Candidatus Binataceae bacterium]
MSTYEVDVVRVDGEIAQEIKTIRVEAATKWHAMNAAIHKAREERAWKRGAVILATNVKVVGAEK